MAHESPQSLDRAPSKQELLDAAVAQYRQHMCVTWIAVVTVTPTLWVASEEMDADAAVALGIAVVWGLLLLWAFRIARSLRKNIERACDHLSSDWV